MKHQVIMIAHDCVSRDVDGKGLFQVANTFDDPGLTVVEVLPCVAVFTA